MKTYTITKDNEKIKVKKYDDGSESHYDSNGNEIYHKYSNGLEEWREYDKNNNCIHYKNSKGFEYWKEYDKNNNCIHYKNSKGDKKFYISGKEVTKEEWFEYYYLSDFQYKYIYDIILTLKDNSQKINIDNIKKHLHNIDINDIEEKYKKILKYHKNKYDYQ